MEDPEQLFIKKEAIGRREARGDHMQNCLVFTEEMCFDEEPQRYHNLFTDKLVVCASRDYELRVCPLRSKALLLDSR